MLISWLTKQIKRTRLRFVANIHSTCRDAYLPYRFVFYHIHLFPIAELFIFIYASICSKNIA